MNDTGRGWKVLHKVAPDMKAGRELTGGLCPNGRREEKAADYISGTCSLNMVSRCLNTLFVCKSIAVRTS